MSVLPKFVSLSERMLATKAFLPHRITPKMLAKACEENRAYIQTINVGGQEIIVAFGALWDSKNPGWIEAGTIFGDHDFPDRSTAFDIFGGLRVLMQGRSCFMVSRHERVIAAAKAAGWHCVEATKWQKTPCRDAIDPSRNMGNKRILCYRESSL